MRFATLSSCAVLALAAVATVVTPHARADAAPSVSAFAGSYSGYVPAGLDGQVTYFPDIAISNGGRVTGTRSGSELYSSYVWTIDLTGTIGDKGNLSLFVRKNWFIYETGEPAGSFQFRVRTTMTEGAGGVLTGTWTDRDGYAVTFAWTPK